MGAEALSAIQDLRWMIALLILLIVADFRFGIAENNKRHKEALEMKNATLSKLTEFHMSRAIRRTFNKFIDYMTLLLVFCLLGLAITEPYGICSHTISAGLAIIIAFVCEVMSIFGHFFYLKGIETPKFTWKSVGLFVGRVLASFAKTKSPDFGEALDETLIKTLAEDEEKEEEK